MIPRIARRVVGLIAACLLTASPVHADLTLRELADQRNLNIGAMIVNEAFFANTPEGIQQRTIAATQFNAATIGTYWTRTRPTASSYDWVVTDQFVGWAVANGMDLHMHPLLYPTRNQSPNWLVDSQGNNVIPPTTTTAMSLLTDHINTAVNRYRAGGPLVPAGTKVVWDVVNEAVGPDGNFRDSWWMEALPSTGPGLIPQYIVEAFRLARQADPHAVLVYNDHDMELNNGYQNGKWSLVQQIVTQLHSEGLIDGLGWELHTNPDEVLGSQFALGERMAWVENLGLRNFVSELDVELNPALSPGPALDAALASQAAAYKKITEIWLDHGNGGWFQTWGIHDGRSWLGSNKRPLLFDSSLAPKPAFDAVYNAVAATAVPEKGAFWSLLSVASFSALGLFAKRRKSLRRTCHAPLRGVRCCCGSESPRQLGPRPSVPG